MDITAGITIENHQKRICVNRMTRKFTKNQFLRWLFSRLTPTWALSKCNKNPLQRWIITGILEFFYTKLFKINYSTNIGGGQQKKLCKNTYEVQF